MTYRGSLFRVVAVAHDAQGRLVSIDSYVPSNGFGFHPSYSVCRFPVGGGFAEARSFHKSLNDALDAYRNLLTEGK